MQRRLLFHLPVPYNKLDDPAPVAQWIEHPPSKRTVTGSSPVGRAIFPCGKKRKKVRRPFRISGQTAVIEGVCINIYPISRTNARAKFTFFSFNETCGEFHK